MKVRCHIRAIACEILFKTLESSHQISVWWVNPQQPSQILHLGQYHLQHDAWCDVLRGGQKADDATCLSNRPAVKLKVADLALVRDKAQALFAKQAPMSTAA